MIEFSIYTWPEQFRPTLDNMQDLLKWFILKYPGRKDLVVRMTKRDHDCLNKHIGEYCLAGEWGSRDGVELLFDKVDVYMFLGIRIYIHIKE